MFTLTSASTRLITDDTQKKSRIFFWMTEMGGTVPVLGKDRHLCRTALRDALAMYGFSLAIMSHLTWVPRCAGCHHPHYTVDLATLLHYEKRPVDLHVRMR